MHGAHRLSESSRVESMSAQQKTQEERERRKLLDWDQCAMPGKMRFFASASLVISHLHLHLLRDDNSSSSGSKSKEEEDATAGEATKLLRNLQPTADSLSLTNRETETGDHR